MPSIVKQTSILHTMDLRFEVNGAALKKFPVGSLVGQSGSLIP